MVAAAVSLALGITTEVRVTFVFDSLNCPDFITSYGCLSSQMLCFVPPAAICQYHISNLSSLIYWTSFHELAVLMWNCASHLLSFSLDAQLLTIIPCSVLDYDFIGYKRRLVWRGKHCLRCSPSCFRYRCATRINFCFWLIMIPSMFFVNHWVMLLKYNRLWQSDLVHYCTKFCGAWTQYCSPPVCIRETSNQNCVCTLQWLHYHMWCVYC
jgi:hypothetical protein